MKQVTDHPFYLVVKGSVVLNELKLGSRNQSSQINHLSVVYPVATDKLRIPSPLL